MKGFCHFWKFNHSFYKEINAENVEKIVQQFSNYWGYCKFDDDQCHAHRARKPGLRCEKCNSLHKIIRLFGIKEENLFFYPD